MKKKLLFILILITLSIFTITFLKNNKKESSNNIHLEINDKLDETSNSESDKQESENTSDSKEEKTQEKDEVIKNESNNEHSTNNSKSTIQNSSSSSDNNRSSNQTNTQSNNTSDTSVVENKKEETKEVTSKSDYIGVPDPNSPYYAYHHGNIEYSTIDKCLESSERINLQDTEDILNSTCIDVVDSEGTILGEYLYINCKSGNCNKYK